METVAFDAFDYSIFIILLCLSVGISAYFGYSARRHQSTGDYLYGNRQMKAIPVGLSLYSSTFSAASIIGLPFEIYNFGTHHATSILGVILGMFVIWYTLLPVFCGNLSMKSPYEYFERRFDYKIRLLSTCVYILHVVMLMPVILYAPSIALSHMIQIPVFVCTTMIGAICVLYTTFGGFKAVIWTDTLQASLMLLSIIVIAIVGVDRGGGLSEVWNKASEGNMLNFFDMDPNPLKRITFWTSTIGLCFVYLGHSGTPASALQRYMSVPGQKDARISTIIGVVAAAVIHIVSLIIGLSMYAVYNKCDPLLKGDMQAANQIMTYFVTRNMTSIPGLSGLFMAGLLSAALSTLSSELNTVGGLIYNDIILKFCKQKWIIDKGAQIMKFIVLINGIIYLCIVPFLNSPHVYELAIAIGGITNGSKIGILLLGLFCLKTNTKGIMAGTVVSISIMAWINIGSRTNNVNSYFQHPHSTDNCPISNMSNSTIANVIATTVASNITTDIPTTTQTLQTLKLEDIFILYRISVFYYAVIGTIIMVLVAVIVSYLTGTSDVHKIDPLLVSPLVRPYLQQQQQQSIKLESCTVFNEKNIDL